jgi:hypothetical protein
MPRTPKTIRQPVITKPDEERPAPKPEAALEPVTPKPVAKPAPVKPARAAVPKPVKPVRPPKAKQNLSGLDRLGIWAPRLLPLAALGMDALSEYGFEWSVALSWAAIAWAAGMMIRFYGRYSGGGFRETTVQELLSLPQANAWHGIPVQLKGKLEVAAKPPRKAELVDATGRLKMDQGRSWDVMAQLFGLSGLARLPAGEIVLQGWFRKEEEPVIEAKQLQVGTLVRTSSVRMLRWIAVIGIALIGCIVLVSMD